MWRFVSPAFEADYRIVLFDHVGAGGSDLSAYDPERYGSLRGYAEDVLEVCKTLELSDVVFVGHSVSAMIGVLAAQMDPSRIGTLALAAIHRRRGLRRRVLGARHRRAAGVTGQQLPRLVERDGAGDHGKPGPPRARR
jgi:pimeloyl-ACP methyl ester carboxylesterase